MLKYQTHRIVFLSAFFICCGCSTFETRDIYAPAGKDIPYIEYGVEDIKLNIGFDPDTDFYSIGLLGVPVIPIYMDTSDPRDLILNVSLELKKNVDFTFENVPCLTTNDSTSICPRMVEVSAIALYQDDGSTWEDKKKRWHKISQFYDLNNRQMKLPITEESHSINRDKVYEHYGYEDYPKWDFFRIDIKYKYQCEGDCPKQLSVGTTGLVEIDNMIMPRENISFTKTKEKDYYFTRSVQ
jgi:hypothetical protein